MYRKANELVLVYYFKATVHYVVLVRIEILGSRDHLASITGLAGPHHHINQLSQVRYRLQSRITVDTHTTLN